MALTALQFIRQQGGVATPTVSYGNKPLSALDFIRQNKIEAPTIPTTSKIRKVSLRANLGGGEYLTSGPGTLHLTPRSYADMPTKEQNERDHIISVALGGTSSKRNLQYLATTTR